MNRVATLATAEKEKAIGEHTSIVQMPPERNEPSCLGGGEVALHAKSCPVLPLLSQWRQKAKGAM